MAKKYNQKSNYNQGGVSMISVIFASLLLLILTVGFINLMSGGQTQSTNSDLSQSAYDSAMAGVEDAKKVIRNCLKGDTAACRAIYDYDKQLDCHVIARATRAPIEKETIIRSRRYSDQESFQQAYTCVNILMNTQDYRYQSKNDTAELIPLKSLDAFSQIRVQWFTQDDVGVGVSATAPNNNNLPPSTGWGSTAPPLLRAQVITPGNEFSLDDIDGADTSQTVFIRPSQVIEGWGVGSDVTVSMSPSGHPRPEDSEVIDNNVEHIRCFSDFSNQGYSCSVILDLGRTIPPSASKNAFLRLNTMYNNNSNVKVELIGSSKDVKFNGAQPIVESNGRANNLFRRVEARLRIGDDFPHPNYSLDVEQNICKDFLVDLHGAAFSASCKP